MVLALDQDEMLVGENIADEIDGFWHSPKKAMMFKYEKPMPTRDGHDPLPGQVYPSLPHMKLYKWEEDLSYIPYMGLDQITRYANGESQCMARTKIRHYCMWNKRMEREKKKWIMREYGVY
jgi:hypothetical protein